MITEYVQETEEYYEGCFKFADRINKFGVKLFYDGGNLKSGRYNGMFDIYVEDWKVKSFKGFSEFKSKFTLIIIIRISIRAILNFWR